MPDWSAVDADALPDLIADALTEGDRLVRVAIDGPPCTTPDVFAAALIDPIRARGRPVAQVRAATFWRDASLRLEMGREDVESYLDWLDADALRREVLDAAARGGHYLPSLRDPRTNRSTREQVRRVEPGLVLLVSGSLLLRHGLPFDRTVHISMSPSARARRTPAGEAWTLPAYDAYDADVRPVDRADVVIKLDDPRHPAIRWN